MNFEINPEELIELVLRAYHEGYADAKKDAKIRGLK